LSVLLNLLQVEATPPNWQKKGLPKTFNRIIAVGGDGTVNEVARGLLHTATPMGIIPKGSGNGLARHLGINMKIDPALEQVLGGSVIAMDTFRMNDHLSLNVSGIGFDGHIANLFGAGKKRGFWGYTKLVVQEYLRYSEFDSSLFIDGQSPLHSSIAL
jgi:diacylglycerol kinase (ATP)